MADNIESIRTIDDARCPASKASHLTNDEEKNFKIPEPTSKQQSTIVTKTAQCNAAINAKFQNELTHTPSPVTSLTTPNFPATSIDTPPNHASKPDQHGFVSQETGQVKDHNGTIEQKRTIVYGDVNTAYTQTDLGSYAAKPGFLDQLTIHPSSHQRPYLWVETTHIENNGRRAVAPAELFVIDPNTCATTKVEVK